MNKFLFLTLLFLASLTQAAPAVRLSCEGSDLTTGAHVNFDFVLSDHDGHIYTYQALERFWYDGGAVENYDISAREVSCGSTDQSGNPRKGSQYWQLNNGMFKLNSGCENEALLIEAKCIESL